MTVRGVNPEVRIRIEFERERREREHREFWDKVRQDIIDSGYGYMLEDEPRTWRHTLQSIVYSLTGITIFPDLKRHKSPPPAKRTRLSRKIDITDHNAKELSRIKVRY